MIKVRVEEKNGNIFSVQMAGHADYDDLGKDIVCSAASSIVITSVNAIKTLVPSTLSFEEKKNQLSLIILEQNDICEKLLRNMISLLVELSEQYPKNIRIM